VGYRRSPDRIAASKDWQRFVHSHSSLVDAACLPPAATARIEDWDDFLTHGYLAEDPGGFSVDQLGLDAYRALAELVGRYFEAGYEFYTPMALNENDQERLRARFGQQ
jgi:hypothetical protein